MVTETAATARTYRRRPVCRSCGRKIGNAWRVRPSESYKSYDPTTNTYLCTPCRYEERWVDVKCPRCGGTARRRLGQLHRLRQWGNGQVQQDADDAYVYLCPPCHAADPTPAARAAMRAGSARAKVILANRVRQWKPSRLRRAVTVLLGEVPPDLAEQIDGCPADAMVGRDGYAVYRAAVARRAVAVRAAAPTAEHRAKAARARCPRRALRLFLRGLDDGQSLVYQCRGCCELAHLRPGHVRRGRERAAASRGVNVGVLCAECWRKYPDHRRGAQIPGWAGWVTSPDELRGRVMLLLRARLGELGHPITLSEHRDTSRIEERLRVSRHPWCRALVTALDRLNPSSFHSTWLAPR